MKISEFLVKYGDKEIDEKKLKEDLGINSKVWKPKKCEKYYCIGRDQIVACHYGNDYIDEFRIDIGNCFKTSEEAEFMVEKLKVIKELKDFALENNDKIDWTNVSQSKWNIACGLSNYLVIDRDFTQKHNAIYFTSEELCRLAIEKVGEDRIKKYYLEVE